MFTDLFNIKNTSCVDGKLSATVTLNASHAIFDGHFPGQPVLPGVCQLALVKELLEKQVDRKLTMGKAQQAKFMSMLDPRRTVEVEVQISFTEAEGNISAQSTIVSGEIIFLKLKSQYANA